MILEKIAAGGTLICNDKKGIIGAIIKYNDKNCILTAYHVLRAGNCGLSDKINIGEFEGQVIKIMEDYDLAIIEIYAPQSILEFSKLKKPDMGPAHTLKGNFKNPCNIMTIGKVYHYISFPFKTMPLPGDSGSPIIQNGNIVGILASVFHTNANAIAISLELFLNDQK